MNRLLLAMALAGLARAQSVEIYSELQRPDPFGGIVQADRGRKPREILSPAMPRGGHLTLHVAVSVPEKESYLLYVTTNPVDACRVRMYREHFTKTKDGWIPDRLTELHQLPDFGTMPDPSDGVPGQTTRVYLLDVWVPPDASAGRFRLEVQVKVADWIIRPLEIRVEPALAPELKAGPQPPLPPIEAGADAAALAVWAWGKPAKGPEPDTVRAFLRRNAMQDLSLGGIAEVQQRALDLLRLNTVLTPRILGAEWWLRVRDYLVARR